GLDAWDGNALSPACELQEKRLAARLGVDFFRTPPPRPRKGIAGGGYLPFVRFPLWHFCQRCRSLKRVRWNDSSPQRCESNLTPQFKKAPPCGSLPDKKRWRMVPVRFVVACPRGHIEDFPWIEWVHTEPGKDLVRGASCCSDPALRLDY